MLVEDRLHGRGVDSPGGAEPGPVLALVAGSHGTEYASIIALEKLIAQLNPADIAGTVWEGSMIGVKAGCCMSARLLWRAHELLYDASSVQHRFPSHQMRSR